MSKEIKGQEETGRESCAIEIDSGTKLSPAELKHHFRVLAGPGAGKTHWLVNHIKNVVANSKRLNSSSKIACITYTNTAADEINERLGNFDDSVEATTIHSFLYKNIVKPYAFLIRDEDGTPLIEVAKLDGHDEHKPSMGKITKWGQSIYSKKKDTLIKSIKTFRWTLYDDDSCIPGFGETFAISKTLHEKGYDYKTLYWKEGIIHHEDVLYFSHRILKENPTLRGFIAAKYKYIFLDEFQDTHPIQTRIVTWLAEKGSIVGVIGDSAQAIFEFNGAKRDDFTNFKLEEMKTYAINRNRRSTPRIIKLLNHLRATEPQPIKQTQVFNNHDGTPIKLIVSKDVNKIRQYFYDQTENNIESRCILARKNKHAAAFKKKDNSCHENPWDEFYKTGTERAKFIEAILLASEYASQKMYDIAVKEILKILRENKKGELREPLKGKNKKLSGVEKRGIAFSLLEYLVNKGKEIREEKLGKFYENLGKFIEEIAQISLTKITGGKIKKFADSTHIKDLLDYLNLLEENNKIRTIHKAKGSEFDSVLLYLDDSKDLDCILNPDMDNEEHRIVYVALSRAKNNLFISVPKLDKEKQGEIERLGIVVENLE